MLCNRDKQEAHGHCLLMFNSCSGGRVVYCVFFKIYVLHLTLSFSSACPQGTFKSFQGAGLCQQCPLNSRSTIEAATLCGCRNGYYRGDMDKPEDVCTSESLSVKQTYTLNKPFSNVVECDYSIPQGDGDTFAKANFWTGVTNSWHITAHQWLSPISPHWIKGQYLLWFIIPTLILCTLFRASMLQCSCPCSGIWGAVSNNTATFLRLSIEVNMCLVCWRGHIAMQDEAQSLKNAASQFHREMV